MIDLSKTVITPKVNGYLCEIKDAINITIIYIMVELHASETTWSITAIRPKEWDTPILSMSTKTYDAIKHLAFTGFKNLESANFYMKGNNRDMTSILEFYEDQDGTILGKCMKYIADQIKIY